MATQKDLVSIVLPIYNVEKYLDRCIESIVNQTYDNLEIILVDDGSPDDCPRKSEEWARKDDRIKVVHKENAGLGMARNTGIEHATGKYICFFDSDDYVALDAVGKCYKRAETEEADIVVFGFCNVKNDGRTGKCVIPYTNKQTYQGSEVQEVFLPNLIASDKAAGESAGLWMSAWASFYSMDLIRRAGWRFVSEREIISEDIYSLLVLYKDVKCVSIISEALYFYCENEGSLTHTYKGDRYERIKYCYDICIHAADEYGYGRVIKSGLAYSYISNTIAALKMIAMSDQNRKDKLENIKEIVLDGHLQKCVEMTDMHRDLLTRRTLVFAIRRKWYRAVYCMVILKIVLQS